MKNNFKILTKISLALFAFCSLIFLNGAGAFFNDLILRATAEENSLPCLELSKSISPDEILPDGTVRITLGVEAIGESYERHSPVDVMHVIDTSGSMDWYGNIVYSSKGNLSSDWEQIDSFSADSSSDTFDVLLITNSSDYDQHLRIKSPEGKWYGYRKSRQTDNLYRKYKGAENIRIEGNNFEEGFWEIFVEGEKDRPYVLAIGKPPIRIDAVKEASKHFIDIMQANDQIGVVSFSKKAYKIKDLTPLDDDRDSIKKAVDSINPDGTTAIGRGIKKAIEELDKNGRSGIVQAMILLSDGVNNVYGRNGIDDPIVVSQTAREAGIIIYTIGIGEADQNLLEEIAGLTGGQYYYVNNSDNLLDIYNQISQDFSDLAASDIIIRDILPDYIEYIGNASEEPNEIIENSDGTTTLVWNLEQMKINDSWSASFNVNVHKEKEIWPTNIYPDSKIDFFDYQGENAELSFPEVLVKIISEDENGGEDNGSGGDNGNENGEGDGNNNGGDSGGGTGGGGGWIPLAISYPDLTISKTDKRDKVLRSEELTYKISWQNIGKASASGLTIIDTLSDYISFVFASDDGIYNSESHSVSWNISEPIKSGDNGYVSLGVRVLESIKEETVILNQAEISTETKESNVSNNKAEDETEITGIVLGEETVVEKTEEPKVLPEAGSNYFIVFLISISYLVFSILYKYYPKYCIQNTKY